MVLLKATAPLLRRHPHRLYAAMPSAPLKSSRTAKKGRTGRITRALPPSPPGIGRRGTSEPPLRPRSARIRNRAANARRSDVDECNDDHAGPLARSNQRARGTLRPIAQPDKTGSAQEQDGINSKRSASRETSGRRPNVRRDSSSNAPGKKPWSLRPIMTAGKERMVVESPASTPSSGCHHRPLVTLSARSG